jgi:hypothetical protein
MRQQRLRTQAIGLVHRVIINEQAAVLDLHPLTRHCHHPPDGSDAEAWDEGHTPLLARKHEADDLTSFRISEVIGQRLERECELHPPHTYMGITGFHRRHGIGWHKPTLIHKGALQPPQGGVQEKHGGDDGEQPASGQMIASLQSLQFEE